MEDFTEEGIEDLEPITAGLLGRVMAWVEKYTSAERRANAAKQLRDRYGRFAEMGRGYKFKLRDSDGNEQSVVGKYIGPSDIDGYGKFLVEGQEGFEDGIYHISNKNFREFLASLDPEYLKSVGITPGKDVQGNIVGERSATDIPDIANVRIDPITDSDKEVARLETPRLPDLKKAVEGKEEKSLYGADVRPGAVIREKGSDSHGLVTEVQDNNDGTHTVFIRMQDGERRKAILKSTDEVAAWTPEADEMADEGIEVPATLKTELAFNAPTQRQIDSVLRRLRLPGIIPDKEKKAILAKLPKTDINNIGAIVQKMDTAEFDWLIKNGYPIDDLMERRGGTGLLSPSALEAVKNGYTPTKTTEELNKFLEGLSSKAAKPAKPAAKPAAPKPVQPTGSAVADLGTPLGLTLSPAGDTSTFESYNGRRLFVRTPDPGAFRGVFREIFGSKKTWKERRDALYNLNKPIVAFDTETTGISDFDGDGQPNALVQLGATLWKNGKIVGRFNRYVKPIAPLGPWSAGQAGPGSGLKRQLTNPDGSLQVDSEGNPVTEQLTDEWLAGQENEKSVLEDLIKFMGDDVLMVAQNSTFDLEVLQSALRRNGLSVNVAGVIDSMSLARSVFPSSKQGSPANNRLPTIMEALGKKMSAWHSADGDAYDALQAVLGLFDLAASDPGVDESALDFSAIDSAYRKSLNTLKRVTNPDGPASPRQVEQGAKNGFSNRLIELGVHDKYRLNHLARLKQMTRKEAASYISTVLRDLKSGKQTSSNTPSTPSTPGTSSRKPAVRRTSGMRWRKLDSEQGDRFKGIRFLSESIVDALDLDTPQNKAGLDREALRLASQASGGKEPSASALASARSYILARAQAKREGFEIIHYGNVFLRWRPDTQMMSKEVYGLVTGELERLAHSIDTKGQPIVVTLLNPGDFGPNNKIMHTGINGFAWTDTEDANGVFHIALNVKESAVQQGKADLGKIKRAIRHEYGHIYEYIHNGRLLDGTNDRLDEFKDLFSAEIKDWADKHPGFSGDSDERETFAGLFEQYLNYLEAVESGKGIAISSQVQKFADFINRHVLKDALDARRSDVTTYILGEEPEVPEPKIPDNAPEASPEPGRPDSNGKVIVLAKVDPETASKKRASLAYEGEFIYNYKGEFLGQIIYAQPSDYDSNIFTIIYVTKDGKQVRADHKNDSTIIVALPVPDEEPKEEAPNTEQHPQDSEPLEDISVAEIDSKIIKGSFSRNDFGDTTMFLYNTDNSRPGSSVAITISPDENLGGYEATIAIYSEENGEPVDVIRLNGSDKRKLELASKLKASKVAAEHNKKRNSEKGLDKEKEEISESASEPISAEPNPVTVEGEPSTQQPTSESASPKTPSGKPSRSKLQEQSDMARSLLSKIGDGGSDRFNENPVVFKYNFSNGKATGESYGGLVYEISDSKSGKKAFVLAVFDKQGVDVIRKPFIFDDESRESVAKNAKYQLARAIAAMTIGNGADEMADEDKPITAEDIWNNLPTASTQPFVPFPKVSDDTDSEFQQRKYFYENALTPIGTPLVGVDRQHVEDLTGLLSAQDDTINRLKFSSVEVLSHVMEEAIERRTYLRELLKTVYDNLFFSVDKKSRYNTETIGDHIKINPEGRIQWSDKNSKFDITRATYTDLDGRQYELVARKNTIKAGGIDLPSIHVFAFPPNDKPDDYRNNAEVSYVSISRLFAGPSSSDNSNYEIGSISTLPNWRSRGLATALVAFTRSQLDVPLKHSSEQTVNGNVWATSTDLNPDFHVVNKPEVVSDKYGIKKLLQDAGIAPAPINTSSADEMADELDWNAGFDKEDSIPGFDRRQHDPDNIYEILHPGAYVEDELTGRIGRVYGEVYSKDTDGNYVPTGDFQVEFFDGLLPNKDGIENHASDWDAMGQKVVVRGEVDSLTGHSDVRRYVYEIRDPNDFKNVTKSYITKTDSPVLIQDTMTGMDAISGSVGTVGGFAVDGKILLIGRNPNGSVTRKLIKAEDFTPLDGQRVDNSGKLIYTPPSMVAALGTLINTHDLALELRYWGFIDQQTFDSIENILKGNYLTKSGAEYLQQSLRDFQALRLSKLNGTTNHFLRPIQILSQAQLDDANDINRKPEPDEMADDDISSVPAGSLSELVSDEKKKSELGSLSDEQLQVFLDVENSNENFFITGKAGTGKSRLLQVIKKFSKKKDGMLVVAPTGAAANNVDGRTIHSAFGFNPNQSIRSQTLQSAAKSKTLAALKVLVIDEISMVDADLMDGMDRALRIAKQDPTTPFGGVQVLMFGDPYQLPPITKDKADYMKETYVSHWFFDAHVWAKTPLHRKQLTTIFRQKEGFFTDILNAIRDGSVTKTMLDELNKQTYGKTLMGKDVMYLATTRAVVDSLNKDRLDALAGRVFSLPAEFDPDTVKLFGNQPPAEKVLQLKIGAQVMFNKNDDQNVDIEGNKKSELRWVNGTVGTIIDIPNPETVIVDVKGERFKVSKSTWNIGSTEKKRTWDESRGRYIERDVYSNDAAFTQFPLMLAWAVTIHKAQGATYEKDTVDLGNRAWDPGQAYVALSRVTSIDGLSLKRPVGMGDIKVDERVKHFMKGLASGTSADEMLDEPFDPTDINVDIDSIMGYDFSKRPDGGELTDKQKAAMEKETTRVDEAQPQVKRFYQSLRRDLYDSWFAKPTKTNKLKEISKSITKGEVTGDDSKTGSSKITKYNYVDKYGRQYEISVTTRNMETSGYPGSYHLIPNVAVRDLASDSKIPVGILGVNVDFSDDHLYIGGLSTEPSYRRRGIATAMLWAARDASSEKIHHSKIVTEFGNAFANSIGDDPSLVKTKSPTVPGYATEDKDVSADEMSDEDAKKDKLMADNYEDGKYIDGRSLEGMDLLRYNLRNDLVKKETNKLAALDQNSGEAQDIRDKIKEIKSIAYESYLQANAIPREEPENSREAVDSRTTFGKPELSGDRLLSTGSYVDQNGRNYRIEYKGSVLNGGKKSQKHTAIVLDIYDEDLKEPSDIFGTRVLEFKARVGEPDPAHPKGAMTVSIIKTEPSYKRKGLATAAYNYASKIYSELDGGKIRHSLDISKEAIAWSRSIDPNDETIHSVWPNGEIKKYNSSGNVIPQSKSADEMQDTDNGPMDESKARELLDKSGIYLIQDNSMLQQQLLEYYLSGLKESASDKNVAADAKKTREDLKAALYGTPYSTEQESDEYGLRARAVNHLGGSIRELDLIAKNRGLTSTELVSELNSKIKDFFSDAELRIRAFGPSAVAILEDGEFKTQHQTGVSTGTYAPEARTQLEKLWFGDFKKNPVYGYWHSPRIEPKNGGLRPTIALYGDVVFHLKPESRYKATASMSDSLVYSTFGTPFLPSAPLTDSDFINMEVAMRAIDYPEDKNYLLSNKLPFMEAQIHNGVTMDDIGKVTIYSENYKDPAKSSTLTDLKTLLNAHGIKYDVVD